MGIPSYKTSPLRTVLGDKLTRNLRVSGSQCHRTSGLKVLRISCFKDLRIIVSQDLSMSVSQYLRMSGSQDHRSQNFRISNLRIS